MCGQAREVPQWNCEFMERGEDGLGQWKEEGGESRCGLGSGISVG